VHGVVGFWSLIAMGVFASGYPNVVGPDVSIGGQALGAVVFLALGFVPGWLVSKALGVAGLLRVPRAVEIAGLDLSEIPASAYPEGIPPTAEPRVAAAASSNGRPDTAVPEPAVT
jgi:ammonium transporter, Amt family